MNKKLRVYVVDDQKYMRSVIRIKISKEIEGIETRMAGDELEAYMLFKDNPASDEYLDIFVLDGSFPGNGPQPRGVAVAQYLIFTKRATEENIFFTSGEKDHRDTAREIGLTKIYGNF